LLKTHFYGPDSLRTLQFSNIYGHCTRAPRFDANEQFAHQSHWWFK